MYEVVGFFWFEAEGVEYWLRFCHCGLIGFDTLNWKFLMVNAGIMVQFEET